MFLKFVYNTDSVASVVTDYIDSYIISKSIDGIDYRDLKITYLLTGDFDEWELEKLFAEIKKLPECTLIICGSEHEDVGLSKPKYKAFVEMQGALDYFANFIEYIESTKTQIYSLGNVKIYFKCEPIGSR